MKRKEGRLKDLLMFLCKRFKNEALLQTHENDLKDLEHFTKQKSVRCFLNPASKL